MKKFSHLLWENSLSLNVYFLVFIKAKKDKHCWKIKVAIFFPFVNGKVDISRFTTIEKNTS